MNESDTISIYPSEALMDNWKNGVPIEEVKKNLRKELKDDYAYRLGVYIAEEFYKKWDADGGIKYTKNMENYNADKQV